MSRTSKARRDRRKKRGQKGAGRATGTGMVNANVEQRIDRAPYEAFPFSFTNSPEFDAIEDYVDEYARDLPDDDPFKRVLLDRDLSHHSLVVTAHELGRNDFLEGIDALFLACNEISAYAFIKKQQG